MATLALELPMELKEQLDVVAHDSGMSTAEYVLDMLEEKIADKRFLKVADERRRAHLAGETRTYTQQEVEAALGMAD